MTLDTPARAFQDCRWGRFRHAAVERRFRSVGHVKLDGLGGLLAAQLGRQSKGAINPGRYASGKHPVPVDHDPLVDGDRAEIGQQMKRRPMRGCAAPLEQPGRAAKQGARAYGEDAVRTGCLLADPGEQVFVFHQDFLTEAARHVQHIELRRVGPSRIGCQTQAVQVANRLDGLAIEAVGRAGNTRQHFERSGAVDLVKPLEEQRANLQVSVGRDHRDCLETTLTRHK